MQSMITLKIAEMAQRRGITSAYQLQIKMEIPPAMAAKLWKGQLKMIGLGTLNRLCKVLNCKPQHILHYEPDADEVIDAD